METAHNPLKLNDVLLAYKNGDTTSRICITFGLSERRYYDLFKRHLVQFEPLKKMRHMNQKKKSKFQKTLHVGDKVKVTQNISKITSEEKIAQLEMRLEKERKKNQELETLLKVARDELGKF